MIFKFYTSLIVFLIFSGICSSQNIQYFKHYPDSGSIGPAGMVSFSDGSLILAATAIEMGAYPDYYSAYIYKVGENGDIVNSASYEENSSDIVVCGIFKFGNSDDTLIVVAKKSQQVAINNRNDSLLVFQFSSDFVLLKKQSFGLVSGRAFNNGPIVCRKNEFFLSLMSYTVPSDYMLSLHSIDIDSDTMYSVYCQEDTFSLPFNYDITIPNQDSIIYVWYGNDHALFDTLPDLGGSRLFAAKFDMQLQFIESIDTSLYIVNGVSISKAELSSSYYAHGIASFVEDDPFTSYEQHPRICKFNNSDQVVHCTDIMQSEDTITYTGWKTLVATTDAVYSFGYFNCEPWNMPWQNSRSWLVLAKLDTNLQVEKIRLIGEDYFYMNYVAAATEDGGLTIAGTWFDYNAGELVSNLFLLKTDKDLTYSISEQQRVYANEPLVFPNPATDYFNIEKPAEYNTVSMCLMTTDGKTILRDSWGDCNHKVDLNGVDAGNYFVLFYDKTNLISVQMLIVTE